MNLTGRGFMLSGGMPKENWWMLLWDMLILCSVLGTKSLNNTKRIKMSTPRMSLAGHIRLDENNCWNWTGYRRNEYGVMTFIGKLQLVHRVSAHCFLRFNLSSPLHVCHRCDNPSCCNPKHLFIGTNLDNVRDAVAKGRHDSCHRRMRTHCKNGHPYA